MNTRSTHFLLVILISFVIFSCKQEKKAETAAVQKIPVAVTAKSRFKIGDSIAIGFTQPVAELAVKWNGAEINSTKSVSDSIFVKAESEKTGWKQLIVSGTTKSKVAFTDTLSVELNI